MSSALQSEGTRITPRHLIASGALLPIFAPVEVDGRLLGDGGLSGNSPVVLVLDATLRSAEMRDCRVLRTQGKPTELLGRLNEPRWRSGFSATRYGVCSNARRGSSGLKA